MACPSVRECVFQNQWDCAVSIQTKRHRDNRGEGEQKRKNENFLVRTERERERENICRRMEGAISGIIIVSELEREMSPYFPAQ